MERDGRGLNLTWEVKDGILNHRTAGRPSTLEGQVVRLCDKISYIHHDMDDAQRAGIISEDDIPITIRVVLGRTCRERLNTLIHDIVEHSFGKKEIIQSEVVRDAMATLRQLMFDNVYKNDVAKHEEIKAKRMLTELYEYYSTHPDKLSREYLELIERGEKKERVVCDYISGMTDQYSIHKFEEIYIPKAWAVY